MRSYPRCGYRGDSKQWNSIEPQKEYKTASSYGRNRTMIECSLVVIEIGKGWTREATIFADGGGNGKVERNASMRERLRTWRNVTTSDIWPLLIFNTISSFPITNGQPMHIRLDIGLSDRVSFFC